jgi:hypothetical protein
MTGESFEKWAPPIPAILPLSDGGGTITHSSVLYIMNRLRLSHYHDHFDSSVSSSL